jgi:hypothetical protein
LHLLLSLPCWQMPPPPQSLHLLFCLPCSQRFIFTTPPALPCPACAFTPSPPSPSPGSVTAHGPAQARFVFLGGQRARATWRGAGGLAADAARRKGLPQSSMRGGARTSGRNLLSDEPLSHVRLPPASCISDVPANSIQAMALAARSRRCNNYLRERSSHFAAANRMC